METETSNEKLLKILIEEGFSKGIEYWGVPDRFGLMD
jgi:hypothetical protein